MKEGAQVEVLVTEFHFNLKSSNMFCSLRLNTERKSKLQAAGQVILTFAMQISALKIVSADALTCSFKFVLARNVSI